MSQRLERLVNLVAALLEARVPLTRERLCDLVPGYPPPGDAQHRAFERDKDSLRSMGIPLETVDLSPAYPEEGKGYRIRRDEYALPELDLTPDELAALHLAASAIRLEGVAGVQAIWKLGGAAGDGPPVSVANLPVNDTVASLYEAIAKRRTVTFGFRGTPRTVDPWHLAFRRGWWYLTGYDHGRGDERSFRLDRITSPPQGGPPAAFERPAGVTYRPPPPWAMGDEDPVMVDLWIAAAQADRAKHDLGDDSVLTRDDTGTTFRIRVTNRANFRTFVLGLLDDAEVLAPDEIRDELVRWLEQVAAGAGTTGPSR